MRKIVPLSMWAIGFLTAVIGIVGSIAAVVGLHFPSSQSVAWGGIVLSMIGALLHRRLNQAEYARERPPATPVHAAQRGVLSGDTAAPGVISPAKRLTKDQFIALRSLARGRWIQGQPIEWKTNRTWGIAKFGEVPALEAVDGLLGMGLAECSVCCDSCRRPTIQLTESGHSFASGIGAGVASSDRKVSSPEPADAVSP